LPTTGIDVSAQRERVPSIQTIPGLPRERWAYDGGLSLSYEVDLFGRVRRGIEAARGDAQAAQADADAMRLAVIADTVRAYFDVTTSAERVKVARKPLPPRQVDPHHRRARRCRTVRPARSHPRDRPARSTGGDHSLAQGGSRSRAAASRNSDRTRAAGLPADVGTRTETPHLAQPIPVGDGAALLARRPDVRAAERRLAADTARIGVAVSDLYPRISLGGSGGFSSLGAMDVLGAGASRWAVGPLISWAFPNQAAVRARISAAKADAKASLATFDGTVLTALEETERALSAYARAEERVETLARARDEAERAARISLARQREGQIDFLTVLDAERTLAGAEADLVAARRAGAFAQVDVFRALGGGWQQS
jgi:outer membrane protein TolC